MWEQLNEMFKTLSDVLKNAVLLFALLFIYNNTNIHVNTKNWWEQIAVGLIISIFVLLIMIFPWKLNEGLFFDTRSVLISITGVFFGWIPTTIVVIISSAYRIIVEVLAF
jgi:LytS/YehU family sensor histidine kinase